ncbi:MAG: DUF1289 domain-containing protein [Planctomycetota bacterium]
MNSQDFADTEPSPCTGWCALDAATQLCQGCLRTSGEIAAWPSLPRADQRAVRERCAARAVDPALRDLVTRWKSGAPNAAAK